MKIKIVTLFPSLFTGFLNESIIKRAIDKGEVSFDIINLRDYSTNKHHKVDDTPYGGGAGMVLAVDCLDRCISDVSSNGSRKILMSPMGETYTQKKAFELSHEEELILICGHYEGFDERIRGLVDEEISIGDFVLTGGEIPAMAISDSVVRLLGSVINKESYMTDSFASGLLGYPQYTRPLEYKDEKVPSVLTEGNHKLINEFRKKESLRRTYLRRKDILGNLNLSDKEIKLLEEVVVEEEQKKQN